MITAVDSSVLLDVFRGDPEFGPASLEALGRCLRDGVLCACDVVWGEVTAFFPSPKRAAQALEQGGVPLSVIGAPTAQAAGAAWRAYREAGGPRTRMLGDFLIGAHAQLQADRLLSRDRGFYREYFKKLDVLDPTA